MTRSLLLMFASFGLMFAMSNAQVTTAVDCDLMGLVVNVGSDSNSVNLYHPGGYLTFPPRLQRDGMGIHRFRRQRDS